MVCFVWIWEQTAIISLYNINWLVCITETVCVYCAVRTGYLNVTWVICFICIWEQTAIISLYSINWLVCITETECIYCTVRTGYLYIIQVKIRLETVSKNVRSQCRAEWLRYYLTIHSKGRGRRCSYYRVICVDELKKTTTIREQLAQNSASLNTVTHVGKKVYQLQKWQHGTKWHCDKQHPVKQQ